MKTIKEIISWWLLPTILIAIILWMTGLLIITGYAHDKCLSYGYSRYEVSTFGKAYCIRTVNMSEEVIDLYTLVIEE